jgi:hypothetical protein
MKPNLPATIVSVLFATSAISFAEPVPLDTQTTRISMFKNGLAMVTSRADVPEPGEYRVPAPEARYGSLWLNWDTGLKLNHIIAEEVDRDETADAMNLVDLLRANVGSTVSVRLHDQEAWISGELVSMPTRYEHPPIPYQPANRSQIFPPPGHTSTDLMILKTEAGTLALQPNAVAQVRFDGNDINQTVTNQTRESAIRFNADAGEGEGNGVVLRYLAQGIAWSPSYVVEMIDDEKARLACKAVIVNDLMDLEGVDVELIAGYPNLKFASSPTAMGPTPLMGLLASLQQGGQQESYGVMSNSIVMQQRAAFDGGYGGSGFSASIPDLPAGEGAEDLYFYQVPGVTLAKGERGYFPLIFAEVPAKHVYTWDIVDFIDRNDRYQTQPDEVQQVIWHSIELTNTTDQPWTTAPGMTVKDGRVLGQDTLNFTPPKGTSQLKITQAVSIDAQQNEVEIERQRNAETFHGSTYDKVTVEGTLLITNYKDKPVTIKITKQLSGEVVTADGGPEVVKVASGLNRVNPRSRLTWETEAKPGKDDAVKLTYRYSFYTR